MNPSDIGSYGSLCLMKRLTQDVVTVYPIDDDEVTFGCDPGCNVRLYYDEIDALHCKIIFRERKAFMVVLGRSGLLIDNCPVFPSSSSLKSKDAGHTTIPMPNNTEIVVHNKRFVFMYPPKELRPALALQAQATSAQTPKRKLRMSMIRSAEVFSPAPSHDPMVNLKILQSPVKGRLSTSPVKQGKPNESEEIVLVHGDCPRVVEEERDLVILEDIAALPVTAGTAQGSPQTPVRRQPRPSLHRAVLIRSAQRTVMRMEEEEEEKEVEASVSQVPSASSSDAENDNDSSEDEGDRMEGVERSDKSIGLIKKMSGLRKSLEAVTGFGWPFRSGSAQPEEDEGDEEEEEEEEGEAMDEHPFDGNRGFENHGNNQGSPNAPTPRPASSDDYNEEHLQTPTRGGSATTESQPAVRAPALGTFMTPQRVGPERNAMIDAGRYTLGGGREGPQRVALETKWKVKDIVVPLRRQDESDEEGEDAEERSTRERTPLESPIVRRVVQKASEDEKKAIRERRKSALKTPDMFFGGHAPGMGAAGRRTSNIFLTTSEDTERTTGDDDDDQDTGVLLAKMRGTLEDMKRRRSIAPEDGHAPGIHAGEGKTDRRMSLAERLSLSPTKREMEWDRAVQLAKARENETGSHEDVDGDVPMAAVEKDASHQKMVKREASPFPNVVPAQLPGTPLFAGVKDLFRPVRVPMETPKMDGLKTLFQKERQKGVDTPTFEGLEEMMRTPNRVRSDVEEEDGPCKRRVFTAAADAGGRTMTPLIGAKVDSIASGSPITGSKGSRSRSVVKGESAEPMQGIVKQESPAPVPAPRKARSLRSKKVTAQEVANADQTTTQTKASKGRKGRSESAEPSKQPASANESHESNDAIVAKPARRSRKATVEEEIAGQGTATPVKPARKSRAPKITAGADAGAAAASQESVADVQADNGTTKSARNARTAKVQAQAVDAEESGDGAKPKGPTRKARARKDPASTAAAAATPARQTTKGKSVENDQDADPLDSITCDEAEEQHAVVVSPVKKTAKSRSRTTTADGGAEDELRTKTPEPTMTRKAVRGTKKGSARSGTPVSDEVMNKENTPRDRSTSGSVCEDQDKEKEQQTRVEKSATRARKGAKVKDEVDVEPTRSRMRTRTRTG